MVADYSSLDIDTDFHDLGQIEPHDFSKYLLQNKNHTKLGVIFCTGNWTITIFLSLPCNF